MGKIKVIHGIKNNCRLRDETQIELINIARSGDKINKILTTKNHECQLLLEPGIDDAKYDQSDNSHHNQGADDKEHLVLQNPGENTHTHTHTHTTHTHTKKKRGQSPCCFYNSVIRER